MNELSVHNEQPAWTAIVRSRTVNDCQERGKLLKRSLSAAFNQAQKVASRNFAYCVGRG
jgi:hypothetical protein